MSPGDMVDADIVDARGHVVRSPVRKAAARFRGGTSITMARTRNDIQRAKIPV